MSAAADLDAASHSLLFGNFRIQDALELCGDRNFGLGLPAAFQVKGELPGLSRACRRSV
jgi:hypothetical protein